MQNQAKIIFSAVDNTKQAVQSLMGSLKGVTGRAAVLSGELAVIGYAASKAFGMVKAAVKPAYDAVEDFQLGVTKTAAMISSFQTEGDLGENFRKAKDYAEALYQKLESIAPTVLASASDMQKMTEEMIKQGIVLDINNEKEVEGFKNMANAVAVIAAGSANREIQLRQETRALLQGQLNMNSQLAMQLDAMVGGTLKKKLELWQKEGTTIQEIGNLLKGYAAASKDIQGTWAAIGSTLDTIKTRILRNGFIPAYKEINGLFTRLNGFLQEHSDTLSGVVYRTWLAVKGTLETALNLLKPMKEPLLLIAGAGADTAYWFGSFLYVILPPLAERLGKVLDALWDMVKAANAFNTMFWAGMTWNWDVAREAWKNAKNLFNKSGKNLGAAFADGLAAEIGDRAIEFEKIFKTDWSKKVELPVIPKGRETEEERKAREKLTKEWEKTRRELSTDISGAGLDSFQKKLVELSAKADELREKFKPKGAEAEGLISGWYSKKSAEAVAEFARDVAQKEREIKEAAIEAEIEQQKRLLELKKEAGEITPAEAVKEEIRLNDTLIKQKIALLEAGLKDYETEEGRLAVLKKIADLKGQLLSDEEKKLKSRPFEGTFLEGWSQGLRKWLAHTRHAFQDGVKLAETTAQGMQQAFSDFFFDVMTGKMKSLWDYIKGFLEAVTRAVADMLAQKAVSALLGSFMGVSAGGAGIASAGVGEITTVGFAHDGGLIMHSGGLVPRFHFGGLASDEVPAVLKKGERVFSPEHTKIVDGLARLGQQQGGAPSGQITVNNFNALDVQTFFDFARRNPGPILDVVMRDLKTAGPLRDAVQRYTK